jgi:hypothetical protein
LNHKGQKERKGREDDEEEGRLYGSKIFQTFIPHPSSFTRRNLDALVPLTVEIFAACANF